MENLQHLFPQLEKVVVDKIAANAQEKHFKAGAILMDSGQYIKNTMIILEGRVKIYRQDDEGQDYFLYFLEPGQACAMSMICAIRQETSGLTAVADEDTTALVIPLAVMDDLMQHHRSWYQFVLQTYRQRFEEVLEALDQVAFKSMDERLVFYLKKQQESIGSNLVNRTHEEIARDLGSSRVVISRLLKALENKGQVKLHRNQIEILKLKLLAF
ncbi:MAG: Crp/Fnr family transcriptional regulator [Sphingobacteriaceae bacterium]|nr:Crp/Fnr family transcriptional regulator [Sphingobacteriaceae bacterium]